MGGAAIRQVTLWNNSQWSGVVTLGSPLRGAKIAASGVDGTNTAFINNAIQQLMAGPSVGAGGGPPIFPGLGVAIQMMGTLGQTYSSTLATATNDLLMNQFGLTGQTAADLAPGSAYQNGVVNQNASVAKILVWGNESYPLLWRVAGTYSSDTGTDDDGASKVSDAAGIYNLVANGEEALSWINLPLHGFHQWRKGKWQQGRNWLNTDSNIGWQNVIGAAYGAQETVTIWYNTCTDEHYWDYCDQKSYPEDCRARCMQPYDVVYMAYYTSPSDGVVPSASQKNEGGAWQDYIQEAFGNINHGEFKRMNRIEQTMNWVLDGGNNATVFRIHN